jgi:cytoskeletal protein CcmA (bactofilin family)
MEKYLKPNTHISMHTSVVPRYVRSLTRIASTTLAVTLVLGLLPAQSAHAVSSWSPTLLVNTESFQTIDSGDGTTDIELRFGSTANVIKFLNAVQKFLFTKSVNVQGGISGSYLTIDRQANISGALTVKGATQLNSTLTVNGNGNFKSNLSGNTLRVSGNADVQGGLSASGAFRTDSSITINDDADATDATLTFGNTSGNQTIKFMNASQLFQFSRGISVLGTISGSKLAIDGNATISGSLLVKNNIAAKAAVSGATIFGFGLGSCNGTTQKLVYNNATGKFECATDQNTGTAPWSNTGSLQTAFDGRYVNQSGDTMTGALKVRANLSGSTLRIDGAADIHGPLAVSGSVRTDGNFTINDDADSNDATLTFGNTSGNQTVKFLNSSQRFEFSRSIRVLGTISGSALRIDGNATIGGPLTVTGSVRTKGNLSGSTLTVDGAITLHGVTYNAPSSQGGSNTFLRNDGAGNLTWTNTSVGNGSGGILSLHPEYPNAVYFSSGSTYVGQLTMSGGTNALDNSYVWTSSRGTTQDYWISVRVRLPDNFGTWDPVKPIELRYKTGVASASNNAVKVLIKDTTGTYRALTGGEALASTSWTTANITGPESTGTWAAKGYITVYIKVSANSTANANAAVSYLNLNYETTTP